jgi:hypothetical protein
MSQLTGFPHPVGAANVYRVNSKTGEAEVFASDFTNIMDLAFGKHGTRGSSRSTTTVCSRFLRTPPTARSMP